MIRLFAVNILPLQDEACFEACYLRSSVERRQKADTLQMPSDKARCIAAGLLLAYAYKKFRIEKTKELANANSFGYVQKSESRAKYPERLPEIAEGFRGKPEFVFETETEPRIHFNLSHSGNYVICVMADFEVGADIQRRTRVRGSIVRRFFSQEERARMEACKEDVALYEMTFARIWAIREAETKLTGRGIGQMIGDVLRDDIEEERAKEEKPYCIWQGVLDEDHTWAVVSYARVTGEELPDLKPIVVEEGDLFYE